MSGPSAPRKIAGVVLQAEGALRFLPADVALRVAPAPRVTRVPGAPPELVGIALYEGAIVPVVAIGPTRGEMIVCQQAGELLGVVGGEIVRTGSFAAAAGAVDHEGKRVEALDLAAVYARIQSRARPGRWGG